MLKPKSKEQTLLKRCVYQFRFYFPCSWPLLLKCFFFHDVCSEDTFSFSDRQEIFGFTETVYTKEYRLRLIYKDSSLRLFSLSDQYSVYLERIKERERERKTMLYAKQESRRWWQTYEVCLLKTIMFLKWRRFELLKWLITTIKFCHVI